MRSDRERGDRVQQPPLSAQKHYISAGDTLGTLIQSLPSRCVCSRPIKNRPPHRDALSQSPPGPAEHKLDRRATDSKCQPSRELTGLIEQVQEVFMLPSVCSRVIRMKCETEESLNSYVLGGKKERSLAKVAVFLLVLSFYKSYIFLSFGSFFTKLDQSYSKTEL